jgi:DNA-binding CsgD family transcriptional regulator
MSILRFLKKYWQTKSGRRKKKYSSTLGDLLQFDAPVKQKRHTSHSRSGNLNHALSEEERRQQLWINLSPREQDVTAFTCLKYTNRQIAARLGISADTVRSYLLTVLHKLSLDNKADLRVFFAGWDFGEWERRDPDR